MKQFHIALVIVLLGIVKISVSSERETLEMTKSLRDDPSLESEVTSLPMESDNFYDEHEASLRVITYPTGNFPVHAYPSSDFISYGTNCMFAFYDMYAILNVPDMIKCGAQFCAAEKTCSHFVYRPSDGMCWLKTRIGSGSTWATTSSATICGLIPIRACDINWSNSVSLQSCLTLNV